MIAIVQYNAGNIRSVCFALERLGVVPVLTDDPEVLRSADKVIFPGVGEASSAMQYLRDRNLDSVIRSLTQPVLGICLGMQLMCAYSEEGNTDCLGIFDQRVLAFRGTEKVPQMGWNQIYDLKTPVFEGVNESENVYFVHGYYAEKGDHTIATCDYILPYSAALQKDNFYGMQFHPEKSGAIGAQMLHNFIHLS
jgi:imidazole glycerol-phosphate synthase subunit HisH